MLSAYFVEIQRETFHWYSGSEISAPAGQIQTNQDVPRDEGSSSGSRNLDNCDALSHCRLTGIRGRPNELIEEKPFLLISRTQINVPYRTERDMLLLWGSYVGVIVNQFITLILMRRAPRWRGSNTRGHLVPPCSTCVVSGWVILYVICTLLTVAGSQLISLSKCILMSHKCARLVSGENWFSSIYNSAVHTGGIIDGIWC